MTIPAIVVLVVGTALVALFTIWFGFANGSSSGGHEPLTPEERLPLQLLFNATHDGLSESEVSRIQLALYDNETSEKIKNVSFIITLQELGDGEPILRELLYAENGTLTFILAHSNGEYTLVENSRQEQLLNAWVADGSVKPNITTISSPRIQENGVYHLTLELLTVDFVRNIFRDESVPKLEYILDTSTDVSTQFTLVPEFPFALPILVAGIFISIVCANFKMKHKYRAIT